MLGALLQPASIATNPSAHRAANQRPVGKAWAWARIARTSLSTHAAPVAGARTREQWLQSATFGVQWLLPQAQVHWQRAQQHASLPFVDSVTA